MRVLVIDDHPLIHEIMPAVLARALGEVAVDTEATLEAGLARAAAEPPDLVLLDLGLPGCEGIESMARFRMRFPQMPVVVVSANTDPELIAGVLDAGAAGYIPKSSRPEVMIGALKAIAAGSTYVPPGSSGARRPELTEGERDARRLIATSYDNERASKR